MSLGCHATYSYSPGIASVDTNVIPAEAGMTSQEHLLVHATMPTHNDDIYS